MAYDDALRNIETNKSLIDILANQSINDASKQVVQKLTIENKQLYKT